MSRLFIVCSETTSEVPKFENAQTNSSFDQANLRAFALPFPKNELV